MLPASEHANPACHVGVWGRTGSGKTTLLRRLVSARRRLIVFDPMGEHCPHVVADLAGVRAVLAAGWQGGFRVSFKPPRGEPWPALLSRLSDELTRIQEPFERGEESRPITFMVDELAGSFPNEKPPAGLDGFGELCRRGRHYGIQLVGASQRVADVSTVFRSACRLDVYLSQEDATDLEAATRRLGREHRERLRQLAPWHGLVRQSGGAVSEIVIAP